MSVPELRIVESIRAGDLAAIRADLKNISAGAGVALFVHTADAPWQKRVAVMKCMADGLNLTTADLMLPSYEGETLTDPAFMIGTQCMYGHTEAATWLSQRFPTLRSNIIDGDGLYLALEGRHLHAIQWLIKRFDIAPAEVAEFRLCLDRIRRDPKCKKLSQWLDDYTNSSRA